MGKKPREDPYLVKQREEVTEKVLDDDDKLTKGRRYISDPSEAPEGANVQQGPQGGYWYDTGSVEGGGDDSTADDVDGGGDGAPGGMDEDYWNVIESDEGREIASTIIDELGDVGVEYVEEALHQDGSYFDTQFDSVEEALEDAQLYAEF